MRCLVARVQRIVVRQAHGSRKTKSRFPIGSIGRSQILTIQLAPAPFLDSIPTAFRIQASHLVRMRWTFLYSLIYNTVQRIWPEGNTRCSTFMLVGLRCRNWVHRGAICAQPTSFSGMMSSVRSISRRGLMVGRAMTSSHPHRPPFKRNL